MYLNCFINLRVIIFPGTGYLVPSYLFILFTALMFTTLPTDVQSSDFYKMTSQTLTTSGYDHYKISSYAKDAYQCKHNLTHWQNKSLYGFGLDSASYTNSICLSRPKGLKEYAEWVQKLDDGTVSYGTSDVEMKDMRWMWSYCFLRTF